MAIVMGFLLLKKPSISERLNLLTPQELLISTIEDDSICIFFSCPLIFNSKLLKLEYTP